MKIRELFRHTIVYGLGDMSRRLVGFLLIPIYTGYLIPAEYGEFQLSMMFISFTSLIYMLGINTAFFRFYLDEGDPVSRKRIFTSSFVFVLAIDIVLSAALLLFKERIAFLLLGDPNRHFIITLCVIALVAQSLETFPILILRAENRSSFFLVMVLVQLAATLSSSAWLIVKTGMGSEGALLGLVLGYLVVFVVLLPVTLKNLLPAFSAATVRKLLAFGLPFIPSMLSLTIVNISDQYIIRYFRGLEETGLYALSYKIGMAVNLFVTAFRMAWIPFIFQVGKTPAAREKFTISFTYFSSFLILVFLLLSIYIDELYNLAVAPEFMRSKGLVPIIALSYVFFGLHTAFIVGIYLKNKTVLLPVICGASALLNLLLNIILVPRFGMTVAAWTTLISFFLMAYLTYYYSNRCYPVPYRLGKLGGALLISTTAVWISWKLVILDPLHAILVKSLILAFIVYLFIVLKMIPLKTGDLLPLQQTDERQQNRS